MWDFVDLDNVEKLKELLEISTDFHSMAEQLPTQLFLVHMQYSQARKQYIEADLALKHYEANRYLELRRRAAETGEKVTEKTLEASIRSDPNWVKLVQQRAEIERKVNTLSGLINALNSKSQLVQALVKAGM